MSVIGVDLGGTKLAGARFDDSGTILARDTSALGGHAGSDVAALILQQVRALSAGSDRITAVGISVPGIYHADRGTAWAPNIPGWDDFPLRDALMEAVDDDIQVVIDSDRAAYILGETWRGAARGSRDAIYLAVGTGIGAGILVNGEILRGSADIGGAIGWLALQRPYTGKWTESGCFESQASGPGLVRVAMEQLRDNPAYTGVLRQMGDALTTAAIFGAYSQGDGLATRVLDNAIELWGMAAANLVSLFNPEMIVFGGGVFGPATTFLDRIRAEAARWAQPIAMKQVRFATSTLGGDAGLYGAGRLAMGRGLPTVA